MRARRSGIIKSTPKKPPIRASTKIWKYSKYCLPPSKKSKAGTVNTTPAATDSPAEPMVCTILLSKIVAFPHFLKKEIAKTAIGMDALTVNPTFNPKYTVATPKIIPRKIPGMMAFMVNSGSCCSAEINGLKVDLSIPILYFKV